MRTPKQLLILMRDNIDLIRHIGFFHVGLCHLLMRLHNKSVITYEEMLTIEDYLYKNAPKYRYQNTPYWWMPGSIVPRVKWLNEQIEKLN